MRPIVMGVIPWVLNAAFLPRRGELLEQKREKPILALPLAPGAGTA
jgi:hypothetical protein